MDPLFGCQMHQDIHAPHSVTLKYTCFIMILASMLTILADVRAIRVPSCSATEKPPPQ